MKKLLAIVLLIIAGAWTNKPTVSDTKENADEFYQLNAGALLSQFTKAIKPTSFLDNWGGEKTNFLSSAAKLTSAAGLAKSVGSLASFIKPGMFKSGFNLKSLLNTANTAKTMADATGLLKNLEGSLKPEAMTNDWKAKRGGWLNALSLLQ